MNNTKKSSGWGGPRKGAGRPKGTGNKIDLLDLMSDLEAETQMPFTRRLAINYQMAITRNDWARVENYDRAFLNKIVSDKQEVEIVETADTITAKRLAFAEALAGLVSKQDK